MSQPIDEQQTRPTTSIKLNTLYEVAIERISTAYSRDMAGKEGIYYWPEPLPTPTAAIPDPLILFSPEEIDNAHAEMEDQHEYLTVIPMTRHEVLERRSHEHMKPSMQIPIGFIDKPERQQRESLLIDLHGTTGDLMGSPLLIVGAQHSGKATALETMLFWLTTRFLPSQLLCAVIDPLVELDHFHMLPHTRASNGEILWTDGSTDDQLTQFIQKITVEIQERHKTFPDLHRDTQTLTQLWAQRKTIPQFLLIISNYQLFAERPSAAVALKKLVQTIIEARAMGIYLVITSTESSSHFIPAEIMGKCTTRIGLSLDDSQRTELFGKTTLASEPIPGRGLIMTPDQKINQIQLALPLAGKNEKIRADYLKDELSLILY
jgi:DNA segregation ATPase FtsK/SpoIIIE-like protein